jgi:hypothetical protein
LRNKVRVVMTLGLVAAMVAAGPGASLARQASGPTPTETTEGKVVGASITHPAGWIVEYERRTYGGTYGGTYGFTLWRPRADPRAYDLRPDQIAAS